MKILREWLAMLGSAGWRGRVKHEIDEELRFHLEQRTADNIAAGLTPEEAAREARKRFGNWQNVREDCREEKGANLGEALFQDARFGWRVLGKNPGFALITACTLALGVAGNMVIFSIYNTLYLRPFPFVEPSRLVDLNETAPRWNLEYTGLAYPDFHSWREQNRSFEGMAAWVGTTVNYSFEGKRERVRGTKVTHDLGAVLGIKPLLGRGFTPEEDRPSGAKVILLGHGFWQRQFGGQSEVIGKALKLNDELFNIIGVLPPDKNVMLEGEFWIPLAMDPQDRGQGWFLSGVGRLKDGVSLAKAQDDLRRIHLGLVERHLAEENTSPRLTPLRDRYFGGIRPMVKVMLGAVGMVLLIACGNMAALMLARGLARSREFALRQSLGATPRRLAQLIGMESLMLAGLGGLGGLLLGHWGLRLLLSSLVEHPPRWLSFDMDWRVGLFAWIMVLGSALLGAWPVVSLSLKSSLQGNLQSSGQQSTLGGGQRNRLHWLVVGELALTVVLVIQAGLLVQSFQILQRADPGFRPDHVLIYDIALPAGKYGSKETRTAFFQEHLQRLRALPGVISAGAANLPPLSGHTGTFYTIENAPPPRPDEPRPVVLKRVIFPGYFESLGVILLAGRSFTEQDGRVPEDSVVIVDESFARRSWPNADPIGKRIRNHDKAPWLRVIGVARDVKHYGVDQPGHPGVYLPYAQEPQSQLSMVVRTSVEPESLAPSVRALVRESDPDLPIFGVVTMEDRLSRSLWTRRLIASLFAIFSGVALLMAVGGIYGVFSYMVNRRTSEIGIRLALGAQRADVLWMVARQGLKIALVGIALGWGTALLLAPVMGSLLMGVSPVNPLMFGSVALLMTAVALLACWGPARRAMRVQPVTALRSE